MDVVFPPVCAGCGKEGAQWCNVCKQKMKPLDGVLCDVCGLPVSRPGICAACLKDRPYFHKLRAWTSFEQPVRSLLHQLKYKKNISLGFTLAKEMADFVRALQWPVHVVVPVPLGQKRMRERGYNQVAMIAKPLSMALGVEYNPRGLHRIKETRSQVGLSQMERKTNVSDAFEAGKGLKGRDVLLVDDVSTTGATLSAAALALRNAGIEEVYAFTVARALPHHGLREV